VVAIAIAAGEVGQALALRTSEESITAPLTGVAVTLVPGVVGAGLGMAGVVGMLKQKLKLLPLIFFPFGQSDTEVIVQVPSYWVPAPAILTLAPATKGVAICTVVVTVTVEVQAPLTRVLAARWMLGAGTRILVVLVSVSVVEPTVAVALAASSGVTGPSATV